MINLVIFGAPGSGKGTQSDKIVEKYGFKHISTGDVLRSEIKNGTELGKTASQYIEKGQLIPDELMIDILASVYDKLCPCEGIIFDGFPRTIAQAESLEKLLEKRNTQVSAMIDLDVPDELLMERLINRGKTSGRADDNATTIASRLNVYKNQTFPLIEWYKKAGKYHHINGVGEIDDIFKGICEVIDGLNKKKEPTLTTYISKEEIQKNVTELAKKIKEDAGNEIPVFICVLKGAVVFASDLMRAYNGNCEISFIRLASYTGTETSGKVSVMMGLTDALKDRYVIIVEDIVDTGLTMRQLIKQVESNNPKTIKVASLFSKPSRRKCEVPVDYYCFEIPDKFIVGYGLDCNNLYRNLPDIYEFKQ